MNSYTKEIFSAVETASASNPDMRVETHEAPGQFFPEKGSSGHIMSVFGGGVQIRLVAWESPANILPRFFLAVWKNGQPVFETPTIQDAIDLPTMQTSYLPYICGSVCPC